MDNPLTTVTYKRFGRAFGSKNYGAISLIARTMKAKGVFWVDELIDSYKLYKTQLAESKSPDPTLLLFWLEILPYITPKMIERETRGRRPRGKPKNVITRSVIAQLEKLEGRKE